MTYEQAKQQRDELDANYRAAGDALKTYPRLANGLTPNAVRTSPAYRNDKAVCDAAFAALRAFNKGYVKTFNKEIKAEKRGL